MAFLACAGCTARLPGTPTALDVVIGLGRMDTLFDVAAVTARLGVRPSVKYADYKASDGTSRRNYIAIARDQPVPGLPGLMVSYTVRPPDRPASGWPRDDSHVALAGIGFESDGMGSCVTLAELTQRLGTRPPSKPLVDGFGQQFEWTLAHTHRYRATLDATFLYTRGELDKCAWHLYVAQVRSDLPHAAFGDFYDEQ